MLLINCRMSFYASMEMTCGRSCCKAGAVHLCIGQKHICVIAGRAPAILPR